MLSIAVCLICLLMIRYLTENINLFYDYFRVIKMLFMFYILVLSNFSIGLCINILGLLCSISNTLQVSWLLLIQVAHLHVNVVPPICEMGFSIRPLCFSVFVFQSVLYELLKDTALLFFYVRPSLIHPLSKVSENKISFFIELAALCATNLRIGCWGICVHIGFIC